MRILRSMIGWFLIGLGVFALSIWMSTSYLTHRVASGTLATPVISAVLHQPDVQQLIADQADQLITAELADNGVDIAGTPDAEALSTAITHVVSSDSFIDDLVSALEASEASILAQLTDDTLPLAPLTITVNVSDPLYSALEAIPGAEQLVPPTALQPITFEALDQEAVGNARTGYDWVERVQTWSLWIAIGLIVVGFLIVPRKRWIIPKMLLGAGVLLLGVWFLLSLVHTDTLIGRMPADWDPKIKDTASNLFSQARIDHYQSLCFRYAVIVLALAALAYVVVWQIFRKRAPAEPDEGEEPEAVAPVAARASSAAVGVGAPAVAEVADVAGQAATTEVIANPAPEGVDAHDVSANRDGDTIVFGAVEDDEESPEPTG